MAHYKTIIVSDIHIPSPDNKSREFLLWLKNQTFDQLIFNGDIIDGRHIKLFRWWKRRHVNWRKDVIDIVKTQGAKFTYILGNHDINVDKIAPRLASEVEIVQDMLYTSGKKTYYICHGQQFDRWENKLTIVSTISFCIGTFLYRLNRIYNNMRKKLWRKHRSLIASLKRIAKTVMVGWPALFHHKLIRKCKAKKVQGIICGHLHKTEISKVGRYEYLNSGDQIELCTALGETRNGKREIIDTRK